MRKRLAALPEVRSVYTAVGTQGSAATARRGGGSAGNVRRGSLTIQLDNPDGHARRAAGRSSARPRSMLRDIPGARFQFERRRRRAVCRSRSPATTPSRLHLAAANVEREIRALPGLGTITSSAALQKPEIVIRPVPERAAELGVTTETLSLVTRIATSGDVDTEPLRSSISTTARSRSACG